VRDEHQPRGGTRVSRYGISVSYSGSFSTCVEAPDSETAFDRVYGDLQDKLAELGTEKNALFQITVGGRKHAPKRPKGA